MSKASRTGGKAAAPQDLASFADAIGGMAADTCASALTAAYDTGRRPFGVMTSARWMAELGDAIDQAEGLMTAALTDAGIPPASAPFVLQAAHRPSSESLEARMAALKTLLGRTFDD